MKERNLMVFRNSREELYFGPTFHNILTDLPKSNGKENILEIFTIDKGIRMRNWERNLQAYLKNLYTPSRKVKK